MRSWRTPEPERTRRTPEPEQTRRTPEPERTRRTPEPAQSDPILDSPLKLKRKTTDELAEPLTRETVQRQKSSDESQSFPLLPPPEPTVYPRVMSFNFNSGVTTHDETRCDRLLSVALQPEVAQHLHSFRCPSETYLVSLQYGEHIDAKEGLDIQVGGVSGSLNKVLDKGSRTNAILRETIEELRAIIPENRVARIKDHSDDERWTFFEGRIRHLNPASRKSDEIQSDKKDDDKFKKVGCMYTGSFEDVKSLLEKYEKQYESKELTRGSDDIVAVCFLRIDVALEACSIIALEQQQRREQRKPSKGYVKPDFTPISHNI